jgi:hypothetical protein
MAAVQRTAVAVQLLLHSTTAVFLLIIWSDQPESAAQLKLWSLSSSQQARKPLKQDMAVVALSTHSTS